jgi:hypothetical protein
MSPVFREVSEDYSQIYTASNYKLVEWYSSEEHKQLSEDNLMAWKELYSK